MSAHVVIAIALCLACAACARDPLEFSCPELSSGDLVLTEVRGNQSGEDTYGEWFELYNASGATLALRGTLIRFTKLDGSATADILVRESVSAAPGQYVVLGRQLTSALPHIDYGYAADFDSSMFDTAAVQVFGCDRDSEVDRAIYRNLPGKGTLALDGTDAPTAAANDDDSAWCVDETEDENTPTNGIRGTPQLPNALCP